MLAPLRLEEKKNGHGPAPPPPPFTPVPPPPRHQRAGGPELEMVCFPRVFLTLSFRGRGSGLHCPGRLRCDKQSDVIDSMAERKRPTVSRARAPIAEAGTCREYPG